ncbi:c-type cytochrome [Halomonas sp.]|uniref:c-type cytochrome n=1 Tax=Halomonas sp. TaxID=1486246 RepID=UPI0025C0DEF1|nr:c-type cytochrome [Halomonas sp.]
MKSSKLIMGCLATLGLTAGMATAQANVDRDAIAERLKPAGQLCLQGQDCGTAASASAAPEAANGNGDGIDGAAIYNSVCMACHETGAAGAPVRGDEDAWAGRLDKGWDELLTNSINGIGAMPARGGNPNLSDDEVAASTAYLLEPVMDVPEIGAEEEATTDEDAAAGEEAADEANDVAEAEASGNGNGLDGEALYGSSGCAACHASGAAGAPRLGNADEWADRLDKGMDELYANSINGIGAMPPKGGNMNLSDEEVNAIVDFMVAEVE